MITEDRIKLTNSLDKLTTLIEPTKEALADLPELEAGNLYTTTPPGRLRIDIPLTPSAYQETRQKLGRVWQRVNGPRTHPDGDIYYEFKHKNGVELALCFDASAEGATCERRQVGEKVIPIYEVICS